MILQVGRAMTYQLMVQKSGEKTTWKRIKPMKKPYKFNSPLLLWTVPETAHPPNYDVSTQRETIDDWSETETEVCPSFGPWTTLVIVTSMPLKPGRSFIRNLGRKVRCHEPIWYIRAEVRAETEKRERGSCCFCWGRKIWNRNWMMSFFETGEEVGEGIGGSMGYIFLVVEGI